MMTQDGALSDRVAMESAIKPSIYTNDSELDSMALA